MAVKAKTTQAKSKGKTSAAQSVKRLTEISRAKMLREVDAMLRRLEAWAVANKADVHNPKRGVRLRAVAFAEFRETAERALCGDLSGLWNNDEADAWIDALLAAGVTIERLASRNASTNDIDVSYRLRYGGGASGLVAAFNSARALGPKLMDAAVTRRFDAKNDAVRGAVSEGLDGDLRQHSHTLAETRSELRAFRAEARAKAYRDELNAAYERGRS